MAKYASLVVEGRKVAGSAQTRQKGVILQHGSILLDLDEDVLIQIKQNGAMLKNHAFLSRLRASRHLASFDHQGRILCHPENRKRKRKLKKSAVICLF